MKKLQNKTFFLLIFIFTSFLMIVLFMLNISIYNNEYKKLKENIMRITNTHDQIKPNKDDFNYPMMLGMEVYVITFDFRGNIKEIYNYTDEGLTEQQLIELTNQNISKLKIEKMGNLYFDKYIFWLNPNHELIIIKNYLKSDLLLTLIKSFILFIILELIIIYLSNILTKWLIKPVQESFDKQKQFISDASHELKTPLSIIVASAEALEENPKEAKWLNNIKSESERMNKLISDLLDLSKSEQIDSKDNYIEVDLSKLIKNKALFFESLMFEQKLNLKLNIEENIKFKCNPDRIKELLSILIDNAIKHGYQQSDIEITLGKNKDTIILSVKNQGDEIPLEEQEKIFERFYRIDKSRNRNSNRYGLGLAIAKNIASNHHGKIFVNCKNNYTTFTVEFKQN